MPHLTDCVVCRSVAGVERISPGGFIHEGEFWLVDHAYPTSHLGWVVLVLKRHAEALHELDLKESEELGRLQWAVSGALRMATDCVKEYSVCYCEREGFSHVHFHIIPRADGLGPEQRGANVFAKSTEADVLSAQSIADFSERLGGLVRGKLRDSGGTT